MERVTETKLSLEALRQMKSHGRTASADSDRRH